MVRCFKLLVLRTYIKESVVICFNNCTFQCFSTRKSPNLGMFKREYNPHHWRANRAQSKWHGMLYLVLGLLQRCVPDRVSRNKRAVSDSTLRYQKPVRLFTLRNADNTGTSSFQCWLAELYSTFLPKHLYELYLILMKNTSQGLFLYILLTVRLSIISDNDQLDTLLLYFTIRLL